MGEGGSGVEGRNIYRGRGEGLVLHTSLNKRIQQGTFHTFQINIWQWVEFIVDIFIPNLRECKERKSFYRGKIVGWYI
jgi:hypothetical protein